MKRKLNIAMVLVVMALTTASLSNCGGSVSTEAQTFSIMGTITVGSSPVPHVTVNLTGASTATTTTDSAGNYSFNGLANGAYTVTPSQSGVTITPASRNITISGSNIANFNFSTLYSMAGQIQATCWYCAPLSGATVTLTGSGYSQTYISDYNGMYYFTGLVNGTYTIAPSMTNYTFDRGSDTATINCSNVTGPYFLGFYSPPSGGD